MTRLLRSIGTLLAAALLLGPILGLLIGSASDLGPSGTPRPTAFHWGLTLSDPLALDCLWNSVVATVAVVIPATVAGVTMARIARGLGRRPRVLALALLRLAAGCHPFFAAIGWVALVGEGAALLPGRLDDEALRWILLGLSQFGFASAWVAWWAGRALDRVRADWLLVARLSGARPGWIWRTSLRPLIRPTVARASASAFALLLIEPGAPTVLGLRRTLGSQVVASCGMASRPDLPRAATMAAVALLVAMLARALLVRRGGPDLLPPEAPPAPGTAPARPAGPATAFGRFRALASSALLVGWLLLCLAPALAIVAAPALPPVLGLPGAVPPSAGLPTGPSIPSHSPIATAIGPAMAAGASAVALAMAMAWPLSAWRRSRLVCSAVEATPPLAIGVGLLALSGMLGPLLPPDLARAARWLDPDRSPWLLVAWGTAAVQLPWALAASRRARQVDAGSLQDLARTSGDRRARSRTLLLAPIGLRRILPPALGLLLVAAAGLSPALVLTPLEPSRPLGPSILLDPAGPPLGLAAIGLSSQMLGVALLLRRDPGPEQVALLRS